MPKKGKDGLMAAATWLSGHLPGSSFERARMLESLSGDSELGSGDESPRHERPPEVMAQLVQSSTVAYGHLLGLLEYDRWESGCDLLRSFGEALRAPEPAPMDESNGGDDGDDDDDDSIDGPGETKNERRRRYMEDDMT